MQAAEWGGRPRYLLEPVPAHMNDSLTGQNSEDKRRTEPGGDCNGGTKTAMCCESGEATRG